MRRSAAEVSFLPVQPGHYPLLQSWLAAPHMREWWGDPDEELGYIRDMVEGRDTTRPYVFALDGAPVGYIQCWFIGHHQNETWTRDNPWLLELPSETVGVDLSIGASDKLSQGIGSKALSAFVAMLRSEGYTHIIIDPDPDNVRAIRAYTKAGFRPVPLLEGRTGDVLIMQHEPRTDGMT